MSIVKAPLQLAMSGLAGEYRVASELLLRDKNVFISRLDNGIDLMLIDGKRIQVKTAHLYHNPRNNSSYYNFSIYAWGPQKNGAKKRQRADRCDFYILWCIEANSFYIIPCEDIEGLSGIQLFPSTIGVSPNKKTKFPRNRSKYNVYKEQWDILDR